MKPSKNQFNLSEMLIKSNGTVHIEYKSNIADGQEVLNITSKEEFGYLPHKDLTDVLQKYKPMLATCFYYDLTRKGEVDNILSKITVTGIKLTGSDKTRGIVIKGSIKSKNNRNMPLNTENLRYNSTKYGFEDSFQELEEAIINEAYAFIFEDKRGQLKLFNNVDMTEDEEILETQEQEN